MNADENKMRKKLYDGWASITEWFSQILVKDENFETVGRKLDQLLIQGRPFLTPIKQSFATEYRDTLDDCKCFNAWLFGQLMNMRLCGNLKTLHEKFFHIQVNLLQHLRDYDLLLYQNVFDRYIRLLMKVCKTLESQTDEDKQLTLVFKWSSEFYLNRSVHLPQIEYQLHGCPQFAECINFLISLFISLQHELSVDFCSQILSVLWECALALLEAKKKRAQFVELRVYRFVTYLLLDFHFSNRDFPLFNTVITILMQHIIQEISILCRMGETTNDEDFCALLIAMANILDLNLVCFDYSYPQTMYSLLLQRNPTISDLAQDAMVTFFSKLLKTNDLISVSDFVEREISTSLSVGNINVFMVVIEHILKDNLRYYLWNRGHRTGDKTAINLYQVNKHWRRLLDLVVESLSVPLKRANSSHIIRPNCVNDFRTILSMSQIAVNVKRELELENEEIDILFFANKPLVSIVDVSEKLFIADGSKETLLVLLQFASDLLSFDEAKEYDEKIRRQLMALFTASWLPTLLSTDDPFPLSESVRDKYFSCMDGEIKNFCIVSLMTRIHRFQFADWREEFFYEIVTRRSVKIIQSLPILIHSLNDFELEKFVSAVNTYGNIVLDCDKPSCRNEALNAFSSHIRVLICSADIEHSSIIWSEDEYRVQCALCDDPSSNIDEPILNVTNTSRRNFLYELVVRIFNCSEEAKHNVLFAAVDLFRHIPKTIDLLNLLQPCFRSSDVNVRRKIIEITPYLIFRAPSAVENAFSAFTVSLPFCPTTFENFMKHLEAVALNALADDEKEMQYICLSAVLRISCSKISSEETLLSCVGLLLIFMLNASSAYPTLAERSLKQIAIAHNFQTDDQIFMKYRDDIFPLVAEILVINYRTYHVKLTDLMCEYGSVFNESTINQVLRFLMPHVARDPELAVLLPELSGQCCIEVPRMLHSAFKHILPQVMLFEEAETTKRVMELICKETNTLIFDLLSRYVTKVLAQLFMYYEDQEGHVRWVLKEIRLLASSSESPLFSPNDHPVSDSSVESFLESRFFGVLMKLENRLSTDTFCEKTRRQILSAFKSLIRFMSSSYITSVRFKVILTLRTITGLEKTNAPDHCIDIWDTFVRQLDTNVLGPILSTIFISLLPFLETHRERINRIYRFLIIENRRVIGDDQILQLYFLPQKDCEEGIRTIIDESRLCLQEKPLEKRLQWLLNATKHEVKEIKLHALRHLKTELASHRADVSRLILASDSINRLVFQILDVLVDGFRNSDASVQVASGHCMGEFGAVDPSYIPNVVINENDSKKYNCYELDSVEFVTQAFRLLCRGLQTTNKSANTDAFAVAIQMLIKYYEVDQKEDNKYWCELPEQLREIIRPLQSTRYFLQGETNAEVPHLVFNSGKCLTVQKWAYGWSTFLISLLCESLKVNGKDLKVRKIFTSCKMPMSCDLKCMMFFLPHILLYAILVSNDQNLTKIYEEMYSVVKHDCASINWTSKLSHKDDGPTGTQLIISEELSVASNTDQEMEVICPKIIFNLLDVLHKKYRDFGATNNERFKAHRGQLRTFLGKFKKFQLAQKAFDRKEYMRSLLYLEEYLNEKSDVKNIFEIEEPILPFLVKIYFHLNDVDNVKGIFAKHSLKLHQLQNVIMLHEITDQFQDAAICYQQLLKTTVSVDEERALFYEKRAIQCYLAINQPELALRFVNSLSSARTRPSFYDVECEALWNLSQFEKLDKLVSCKEATADENWGVRIGQSLVYLLKGEQQCLEGELNRIRTTLTKLLHMSTAAMDGYRESYEHTVKLHILAEFEKIAALLFSIPGNARNVAVEQWKQRFHSVTRQEFDERLQKLQPTNRVLQQVLNTRQAMFTVATERLLNSEKSAFVELFKEEIHRCWLKVIEMANRTRNFELAYSNIIAIDNYQVKGFFIEKAKYYWEKKEPQEALRTLSYGLECHYPEKKKKANYSDEDRKFCSDAYILIGMYNDAIANSDCSVNMENFRMAADIYPQSENTLVKLAQYQEKVISASGDMFTHADTCADIVKLYGQSLTYGCEFIYQSFSRMLNIWLDSAERLRKVKEEVKNLTQPKKHANLNTNALNLKKQHLEALRSNIMLMTTQMSNLLKQVPKYYLLTAFSLITSRLSHPSLECFAVLHNMVIECLLAYPDQALWLFTSLCEPRTKNSDMAKELSGRANRILNHGNLSSLHPMVEKFRNIFREFSNLCLAKKPDQISNRVLPLNSLLLETSNLLKSNTCEEILIPAQKFMTIVLPRSTANGSCVGSKLTVAHNPFPETRVTIAKIRKEAYVYSSMQKPVRVTFIGTDGHSYPMIFKAMDDLRIDSRAMEFNAVMNMYLKRDAEARNRALIVRTYTVLPLYQTNGIIEFIPNLETMRSTCHKMRKHLGLPPLVAPTKDMRSDIVNLDMKEKIIRFNNLCKINKPVLHEWYTMEFPNPSSWYTARQSYVRTLAVMSVVGYMLGLGDRHNDNILLDRTNGDIVHVDFNALFNKGDTMPCPERVPFRLTHSMIKAMGLLGYNGGFRYVCEIVNRIIRVHKDQLISVLNTFLYDPSDFLTEQSRSRKLPNGVIEMTAEKLRDVEARMNGVVRKLNCPPSMPLSVEGQISRLIEEATSKENMCQMFVGWAAHM